MRHIGTLDQERHAERLAAYLITQGIDAFAEQEQGNWAIWVRDENAVAQARAAFAEFQKQPEDSRYQGATQAADQLRREERKRREEAQKRQIPMQNRWAKSTGSRKAPLVFTLIGLCVLATIWTNFGNNIANWRWLSFYDMTDVQQAATDDELEPLQDIRQGEVWRLLTPIFVHLAPWHLVFNLYWAYVLGVQIEDRKGTLTMLGLVLSVALISNVAQALFESPAFAGFSGVGYGFFGYVWMKSMYEPESGIRIDRLNVILFIAWFFLSMTGYFVRAANTAHGVGMFVGAVIGYAPLLFPPRGR